ncbi:receptor-type tyrosine-protein phosphatase alpha-like [Mercenaria mercenaria]|uniref:receptor-type tyrosine-protein phosphatase alpha-like n=1 Tax=Mercenaria mercenaria TaxID=6596 RepID=UPI00234E7DB0|nr:receptor-type tyrosine-protein phosphatase alpha-like [Mercenaria mercenaria]
MANKASEIQFKEQYKYLHGIIVEALVLPSQPVHTDKFHGVYSELKEIDSKTRKTKLYLQYEALMGESGTASGNDSEDDNYTSAKRTENKKKNRYDNILAPNEFRPFLLTQVPGCTDYINAVFIPGYRDKFGYILTQTPMQATAIDCCRLVYEQEVKVIVAFQENGDDDIGTYLPEKGSVKLGPYSMAFVAEDDQMNYTKRDYQLTFRSEKRSVTQLMFKQWPPTSLVPSDPCKMLYFLEELETLQRQNDNKTILIQCLNGAERSGLVAVLMNIFERLRFDKEVSIPLVIRQLKVRRQQIVPNFEQFKFCHDVVLSHIESNSTYANM